MSRPQQGQRIVRLVRALTGLGLLMVVITIGLIGWTLSRVRTQRAEAVAEQEQWNRASDELRQRASASRLELQTVLDETQPITNQVQAIPRLLEFVMAQPAGTLATGRSASDQFAPLIPSLAAAAQQGQDWRARYEKVWLDVSQQRTLGQVRALIMQLRGAVETLEGRRRLQDALAHKRWQNAAADEAARLAPAILNQQGREQSQGLNDFKSELAECARLVELLGGEEQLDNLADLKDNKLKPVLDRLGRTSAAFNADSTNTATLQLRAIEQLRVAIFGAGPEVGGLFNVRHDALALRREREKLKTEIAALFQDIESANAGFALSAQTRTAALTQQMEGGLASGWRQLLYVGSGCSALFLWLAWVISRGIHGQVQAIDHARAEAESGRQTTQRLMLEQQAATAELAKAHQEVKAGEHRLRIILETQPECVKQVAADGTLLSMNRAGLCLIEAETFEQVAGRCVYDLVAPEHQALFRELNGAIFKGESRTADFEIIGLKGTRRWMQTHACPLRDLGGSIVSQLAVTSDITERKRAEAEQARLVDMLEASLNEVYVFDTASLRFSYVNRSARQNLGYTMEQLRERTPLDLKPAFTEETFRQAIAPLLDGTVPKHLFQTFHRRADGTDYPVEVCLQMVATATERVFLAVINDITERKRAEAELSKTQKELLDVSRQAGMAEVATSVLHNVGNVLNSVNVSANLVSDQVRKTPVADLGRVVALLREQGANLGAFFTSDPRGPKVPEFLTQLVDKFTRQQESQLAEVAALQKNIEHIKEIVAMQQSFAKVSGLNENLSPIELIGDAVRMNEGSFQKHEVELVQELPAALPMVCVDKHKVLQILVNLLRNAKHACDDAGREDKRITVRATHEHDRVRITVADNGVGIPAENLNRIFNHGFTTKKEGHGFGLHSAANAAKEMGGALTARSDGPGQGATFTLELPAEMTRTAGAKQSLSHAA